MLQFDWLALLFPPNLRHGLQSYTTVYSRLTAKLDARLFADDSAVYVLGHTNVGARVLLLFGVGDNQVTSNQTVVLIRLLQQLDLPIITAPPGDQNNKILFSRLVYIFFSLHMTCDSNLYAAGGFARALQFMEILLSGESSM